MGYWSTWQEQKAREKADGALWRREEAEKLIDERHARAATAAVAVAVMSAPGGYAPERPIE